MVCQFPFNQTRDVTDDLSVSRDAKLGSQFRVSGGRIKLFQINAFKNGDHSFCGGIIFKLVSGCSSGDCDKEIDPRCQYFLEQLTFTDAASLSTDTWNTADPGSQRCNTVIMDIIIEHDQVNPIPLQDAQKSPDLRYVDQNEEQEEAKELFAQIQPLPFRPARQKLGLEIVRQRTISAEEEHGNAHFLQRSRLWRGVVEVEGYDWLELVFVQVL